MLRHTNIQGKIFKELGLLSNLIILYLELSTVGETLHQVFNISSLETFSIASNNISETLPVTLEAQLPNLTNSS